MAEVGLSLNVFSKVWYIAKLYNAELFQLTPSDGDPHILPYIIL